ncbi:uncharacterized protein [Apostichopus japonicus]|uniref:uncharacterized protein n=1 Tax=Stichopus japonicus TaxID=307972 RepID=UPI003AB6B6EC
MDRKTILTYRGPNIGGDGGMNMDPNNNRNIRDNASPNLGTYRSSQVGNLLITTAEQYLRETYCAPHIVPCDRNSQIDERDGFEGRGDGGMNMDPNNNHNTGGYGGGYNGGYDNGYGRGLNHGYGNDGGLGDGNGRGCSFDVARGIANTRNGVHGRMCDGEHHNGEARGYRDGYGDGYVDGHNRASGERIKGCNINNGNGGINRTNGIKGVWRVYGNVRISLNNCNNGNNRYNGKRRNERRKVKKGRNRNHGNSGNNSLHGDNGNTRRNIVGVSAAFIGRVVAAIITVGMTVYATLME